MGKRYTFRGKQSPFGRLIDYVFMTSALISFCYMFSLNYQMQCFPEHPVISDIALIKRLSTVILENSFCRKITDMQLIFLISSSSGDDLTPELWERSILDVSSTHTYFAYQFKFSSGTLPLVVTAIPKFRPRLNVFKISD